MHQMTGSYLTTRRKRKRWQKLVLFLSCLVVFSTTYALILPAITMTEPPLCGLEEHTHDSSCYELVLECPFAEQEPAATAKTDELKSETSSFSEQTSPDFTAESASVIASGSAPYTLTSESNTLTEATATMASSSESEPITESNTPHHHTESCFKQNLICHLTEHQHSDACYQETNAALENTTSVPLPHLETDAVRLTELSADAETALTAHPGETVSFPIALKTAVMDADAAYSAIRIHLEFILPLTDENACFDLNAMTWLDQTEGYTPSVVTEPRLFGETEMSCQVLTGYLLLTAEDPSLSVTDAEWCGFVAVSLLAVPESITFALRVYGAVEYNTWDGICEEHQIEERLAVDTVACSVSKKADAAALQETYRFYLSAVESLKGSDSDAQEAQDLLNDLSSAFAQGALSETAYRELSNQLLQYLVVDTESLAEVCIGTDWIQLRDSGWFTAYSDSADSAEPAAESLGSLQHTAYAASLATTSDDSKETKPSAQQIDNPGGTNTKDDVTVSKTIEGTDLENVFDITLTVQTPQKIDEIISEPDMAVVIVMDISNTMKDNFGGVTRYAAAMEAAEDFLDEFAENNTLGISKVGYVAFNTDAHQIFGLQACTNETQANALKNTMRTSTGSIINADGYGVAHNRFTNIEGGLKMAQDMLAGVSNQNKFIILLTDGFPTTYLESGYKGYDPYDTTGRFYDHVLNVPCSSGTSYSDEAAIRARNMATSIRSSGTTIFSIGVDVGGQTIQKYIETSETLAAGDAKISVVDRTGTTYEIGSATSTEAYKNWLKNSIGSGYCCDSTNTAGLKDAYSKIFEQIKTTVATATEADWVASDPVPTVLPGEIEFIGFYDKDGTLTDNLTGSYAENAENTSSASSSSETGITDGNTNIQWNLKKSGYTTIVSDEKTTYRFTLKYRVRLKNEDASFIEEEVYKTNGTTTLSYRTVTMVNGQQTISESKTIEFPIPSVHGFLGELTFTKVDTADNPIPGAEFTLSHDTNNCSKCRGDGTPVTVVAQTCTSNENGTVSFTKIPSGHTYTLEETGVPAGYVKTGYTYSVQVAYDDVTVTVTKEDGTPDKWADKIVNRVYYQLPSTGGSGIGLYVTGGILLLTVAGFLLFQKIHPRKREKEVDSSS